MGLKLWEFYIRLPQDLVDDPDINLSLNAFRLLAYLCRHQLRLGKAQIRMTQEEVLNGRKDPTGARYDRGSRITGSRNLTSARDELVALGWLKYFCLEGAWVYELIVQEQAGANCTQEQVQIAPGAGAKGTQGQVQIAPGNKEIRKYTRTQDKPGASAASPTEGAVGFHATLRAIADSEATQRDLYSKQRPLVDTLGEGFNAVVVAHAMCIEMALVGQEHRVFLAEVVTEYQRKRPTFSFEKCGEELLDIWALYQKANTGKYAVGWKKFFSEGWHVPPKKDKWLRPTSAPSASPARDASSLIRQRRAQIGVKDAQE